MSLVEHYTKVWGPSLVAQHVCPHQPHPSLPQLPDEFRVAEFGPHGEDRSWKYATIGMSDQEDRGRIEIFLVSPNRWSHHVFLLSFVAHFHLTGERLAQGHTVKFGLPWMPDSASTCGLLSLPYPYGPSLENAMVDGLSVKCLWLIPITERELEFKKEHGLDALEELFEENNLDYANPRRASLI